MRDQDNAIVLVLCNCPDADSANRIAQALLKNKLAACVNVMPQIMSHYLWQGKLQCASEIQLQIKTSKLHFAGLQKQIAELHPYDIPEIIALPVVAGLPAYLRWVQEETGSE